MQEIKRLRVFAGPNGSGKSTLFEAIDKKFNTGYFVNADNIELLINKERKINLYKDYGLKIHQKDFDEFINSSTTISLINKANQKGLSINLKLENNCIIKFNNESTNSYEASLIASFIRHNLVKNKSNFSFETVLSHPSKIEEIKNIKKNNYKTYLYFICTDSVEININNVEIVPLR